LNIKYLKHSEIDKQKWDDAITISENGLVYALSWYLDIVSPNWEALIVGDYDIVMPLIVRKKFGFNYFYKPIFAQFLGIFSKTELSLKDTEEFIQQALKHVKYIDVWFNPENPFIAGNNYIKKQTQILSLKPSYEEILSNYSRSSINNMKKIRKLELIVDKSENKDNLISLMKEMYGRKNVEGVREKDYVNLRKITSFADESELGEYYTIYSDGIACASAFFIKWKNRIIIYHAANELGRKKRAMFLLVDEFIKDHAGKDCILDFAGSNISGVAKWNLGFGAKTQHYYSVKINNLPFYLKWIKK
jgi:hypothetical protein